MNIIQAIILGIVQGLTEFLPVSSSGHLTIFQHIMGIDMEGNLFFNVMLHVGTLVAVCVVYHKLIFRLIKALGGLVRDIFTGKFKWSQMDGDKNLLVMLFIGLLPLFLLFVPIPGAKGINGKDLAGIWQGNSGYFIITGFALLATSVMLWVGIKAVQNSAAKTAHGGSLKSPGRRRLKTVDAVCIGLTQCLAAIFPGLSRSGSTLAMGELRGVNKQVSLDYTFVLGIPSILAAALLEGKEALEAQGTQDTLQLSTAAMIAGMIAAMIVGFFAIKLFKWMLAKDRTGVFVVYTALMGLAVIIIGVIELSSGTNLFSGAPLTFG
ncbi:MAG: undecaprenyl-diphosphate phosphatase [Clostridia bacterium]|nr:undecaprenyl-diphosphate phosphatase [Clostridia bacterium]